MIYFIIRLENIFYLPNLPKHICFSYFFTIYWRNIKFNLTLNLLFKNRDAEDAIKDRDGYNYDGYTLRVEHPRGERSRTNRNDSFSREGPGFSRGGSAAGRGRTGYTPQRRSDNRILVSGFYIYINVQKINELFVRITVKL